MTVKKPPQTKASARAERIARGIVEDYLGGMGGEDLGHKVTEHEERMIRRIAHAIERAAGGR